MTWFSQGNMIAFIYLSGVLFFTGKFIWQLLLVSRLLKKAGTGTAFSFFNKTRIDKDLPQVHTIHKHEEIHIRQLHSLDVLFFEVMSIFIWFNPVIYLYKNDIKNIHEYLADEAAAKFHGDKEQYSLLLLSNTFGVSVNTLTNSFFNKSLIKKRIYTLHKQRSGKTTILKYGIFVPLFAIALVMSSATIRNNEKIRQIADEIPLHTPIAIVKETVNELCTSRQDGPEWKDFYSFAGRSIRYPAQQSGVQGNIVIKFTVTGGLVDNVGIVKSLEEASDAEVMRVILTYKGYKDIKDGKYTINFNYTPNRATPIKKETIPSVEGYTALSGIYIIGNKSN